MYMIYEHRDDDSSSDDEWASWRGSPSPRKWWLIIAPLSMGDKWASCFDTGCINVHDSWASGWWLILRWWMGVMTWVPLPQKMMTHHCPPLHGWYMSIMFFTLGASMYMIYEHQNDDSSSDDEWASWRGSPSPRKWWLIIAPLSMGDKWASCFLHWEHQCTWFVSIRMMTHPQMMNERHDVGPPPPENDDSSLPPYPWVINECHVLTLGASL